MPDSRSRGYQRGYQRFLLPPGEPVGGDPFASHATGHPVLITGAGGFIGSALVRAIAEAAPSQITLLDSSEYNLFRLQRHLEAEHPHVQQDAILGSVTDAALLDRLFRSSRPDIVYHAAAFKHVALLEFNPAAALRNNAIGTHTLAHAASRHGVSRLVLVSTDKAVNPCSIMGASKRLAEMTVMALSSPACRMNAVRLGNVIGSSGSVVPIFLEQIAQQRPVTVAHPEVSRYFLSLGEAVRALLAGGAAECQRRILVPELGEPVHIADLAQFLIDAHGTGSTKQTAIEFTGLRPGDKLTEDLLYSTEVREGTTGPLGVHRTCAPEPAELEDIMKQLATSLEDQDFERMFRVVCAAIPEYVPGSTVLRTMDVHARTQP